MNAENDKVPVMTLTLGGDSFTVDWEYRAAVWAELEAAWENRMEDTYTVSFGLMDRAEFEALPEFEGF